MMRGASELMTNRRELIARQRELETERRRSLRQQIGKFKEAGWTAAALMRSGVFPKAMSMLTRPSPPKHTLAIERVIDLRECNGKFTMQTSELVGDARRGPEPLLMTSYSPYRKIKAAVVGAVVGCAAGLTYMVGMVAHHNEDVNEFGWEFFDALSMLNKFKIAALVVFGIPAAIGAAIGLIKRRTKINEKVLRDNSNGASETLNKLPELLELEMKKLLEGDRPVSI